MQKCVSGHAGKCAQLRSSCAPFRNPPEKYICGWGGKKKKKKKKSDYRLIEIYANLLRTFPIGRHANLPFDRRFFEVERAIWFEFFRFHYAPSFPPPHLFGDKRIERKAIGLIRREKTLAEITLMPSESGQYYISASSSLGSIYLNNRCCQVGSTINSL